MMKFLRRLKEKVVALFRRITGQVKEIIPVGISVVNAIKRISDSEISDVFVELTVFTDLDDKILKLIRKILPKVLKELEEWEEALEGETDKEVLKRSLLKINNYTATKRSLMYLGLATGINKELAGEALSYPKILTATHEAYNDPELLNV